jgi:hypothetical protein
LLAVDFLFRCTGNTIIVTDIQDVGDAVEEIQGEVGEALIG